MDTSNIINIIAEQLGVSPDEITEDTAFADLGADSFDLFQTDLTMILCSLLFGFHTRYKMSSFEILACKA